MTFRIAKFFLSSFIVLQMAQAFEAGNPLKVALLPCIVDAKKIESKLCDQFKDTYNQDLYLWPSDPHNNFYDLNYLKKLLTPGAYDIIEIDAVMLQSLIDEGLIAPWPMELANNDADWHPCTHQVCYSNDKKDVLWGIPHWLCSFFFFSRTNIQFEAGSSLKDRFKKLEEERVPKPHFAMDVLGKYTSTSLYLKSIASNASFKDISIGDEWQRAIKCPEKSAISPLKIAAKACLEKGNFDLTLQKYLHSTIGAPAIVFASKKLPCFAGYSEALYYAQKYERDLQLSVCQLPLHEDGNKKISTVFVDVFVLRKDLEPEKLDAAINFVRMMQEKLLSKYITLSKDADESERVPRYLIPASISALDAVANKEGKPYAGYFKVFRDELKEAIPYPKSGLPDVAEPIAKFVLQSLQDDE